MSCHGTMPSAWHFLTYSRLHTTGEETGRTDRQTEGGQSNARAGSVQTLTTWYVYTYLRIYIYTRALMQVADREEKQVSKNLSTCRSGLRQVLT